MIIRLIEGYLSSSQRAVIALRFEKHFAVQAEKRMKAGVKVEENPTEKIPEGSKGESAEQAAAALKTNDNYVKAAKKLEKEAPDDVSILWCGNSRGVLITKTY
jgi:hypothetical protein